MTDKRKRAKQIEMEGRRKTVASLMRSGVKQQDMAQMLKVSIGTVNRDVQAIIKEWQSERLYDTDAAMRLDLERIEALIRTNWTKAISGSFGHQDRVMRCIDLRSAIFGYAGAKDDSSGGAPPPIAIIEVVRPADTELRVTQAETDS